MLTDVGLVLKTMLFPDDVTVPEIVLKTELVPPFGTVWKIFSVNGLLPVAPVPVTADVNTPYRAPVVYEPDGGVTVAASAEVQFEVSRRNMQLNDIVAVFAPEPNVVLVPDPKVPVVKYVT